MDRGLLDGAEFNNPTSDRVLGFPDVGKVYMVQSYHQASECFEVIFNKTKYDSLAKELQQDPEDRRRRRIGRHGLEERCPATPKDMQAIKDRGVKVYKTPDKRPSGSA